jgi:hypothetical protein
MWRDNRWYEHRAGEPCSGLLGRNDMGEAAAATPEPPLILEDVIAADLASRKRLACELAACRRAITASANGPNPLDPLSVTMLEQRLASVESVTLRNNQLVDDAVKIAGGLEAFAEIREAGKVSAAARLSAGSPRPRRHRLPSQRGLLAACPG